MAITSREPINYYYVTRNLGLKCLINSLLHSNSWINSSKAKILWLLQWKYHTCYYMTRNLAKIDGVKNAKTVAIRGFINLNLGSLVLQTRVLKSLTHLLVFWQLSDANQATSKSAVLGYIQSVCNFRD